MQISQQFPDPHERRAAKARLVEAIEQGKPWHQAAACAGIQTNRTTAQRLFQRYRAAGDTALDDHRHGHAYKLDVSIRHWIITTCRAAPHTPSHTLQAALVEQWNVTISLSYLNEVRAALGVRYRRPHQEKNR